MPRSPKLRNKNDSNQLHFDQYKWTSNITTATQNHYAKPVATEKTRSWSYSMASPTLIAIHHFQLTPATSAERKQPLKPSATPSATPKPCKDGQKGTLPTPLTEKNSEKMRLPYKTATSILYCASATVQALELPHTIAVFRVIARVQSPKRLINYKKKKLH